jgi:hypothetical protein
MHSRFALPEPSQGRLADVLDLTIGSQAKKKPINSEFHRMLAVRNLDPVSTLFV